MKTFSLSWIVHTILLSLWYVNFYAAKLSLRDLPGSLPFKNHKNNVEKHICFCDDLINSTYEILCSSENLPGERNRPQNRKLFNFPPKRSNFIYNRVWGSSNLKVVSKIEEVVVKSNLEETDRCIDDID